MTVETIDGAREARLQAVLVGDLLRRFVVPVYQRGYRWGDTRPSSCSKTSRSTCATPTGTSRLTVSASPLTPCRHPPGAEPDTTPEWCYETIRRVTTVCIEKTKEAVRS